MFAAGARISGIHFPSKVVPRHPGKTSALPGSPFDGITTPPTERAEGAAASAKAAVRSDRFPEPDTTRTPSDAISSHNTLTGSDCQGRRLASKALFLAVKTPRISYFRQLSRIHSRDLRCASSIFPVAGSVRENNGRRETDPHRGPHPCTAPWIRRRNLPRRPRPRDRGHRLSTVRIQR